MAKDKRDEKQSILGELESIKDLLNEDEFADIPTLSNDLSVDDLNVGNLNVDDLSANDLADIPVLTQTPDDIPVLKPAHEVTEAELPQLNIPDLDIPEMNIPELDVPELNIPELDVPQLDDSLLDDSLLDAPELDAPEMESPALEDTPDQLSTLEPTLDFNQELNFEPSADSAQAPSADLVQEPPQEQNLELDYDAETLPLHLTDSLLEQEIDSVEISTEVAEDLNLAPAIEDFPLEAHSAKEPDNDSLEDFNLNEDSSFNESIATLHSEAEDTEDDSLVEDRNLQEDSEFHDINNTIEASPDNGLLPELSKVPYALPGQQSLFESGSPTKSGAAAKGKNQTPESSQAENSSAEETFKKRSSKQGSTTKARGENPFLPQHIRDRLHTSKTLVDIIKEHPPAPEQKAHPTNHIVEEIIADYMPKIEAELRERLLKLADEGKLDEQHIDLSSASPSSD
jgi:hypothetical protein